MNKSDLSVHSIVNDACPDKLVSLAATKDVVSTQDAENCKQHESIPVTDLKVGVVGWDSKSDDAMPLNFTKAKKTAIVVVMGIFAFVTSFASSVSASAQAQMLRDLRGTSGDDDPNGQQHMITLALAIYLLGFSLGPLLLSPLSELHGRRPLILLSDLGFIVFSIACASAPSLPSMLCFRLFQGMGGSGCLTISAGVLGDMFAPHERGGAMTCLQLGSMIAPFVAPIAGGYMAQTIGWRWAFWLCAIIGGAGTIAAVVWVKETNSRVLIRQKTRDLRTIVGRPDLSSCYADIDGASQSQWRFLRQSLTRPLKMLFLFPVVLLLSIAGAVLYGLQYLLLFTLSPVFEKTYAFSPGMTGLVNIPIGLGAFIGMLVFRLLSDKRVRKETSNNDGDFVPESRVPLAIWGFAMLPATFFIYGWCAYYKTHWIFPIIALVPFSCGFTLLSMPLTTYLIDCYPIYAASAMAGHFALRCVCGALIPFAGEAVYEKLGVGWGNTVLGLVAVAMVLIPVILWKFGHVLRRNDAKVTL